MTHTDYFMHLRQGNPQSQHRLGDEGMESSPVEKDLGVPVLSLIHI